MDTLDLFNRSKVIRDFLFDRNFSQCVIFSRNIGEMIPNAAPRATATVGLILLFQKVHPGVV
jgi:hypothetical protein